MTRPLPELVCELRRLSQAADGIQIRWVAYFNLHVAASISGDREELERRRGEMHDILDALLDNSEAVEYIKRELLTLQR
jgi:1,4-alpha-glucan branching enzyme